MTKRSMDSSPIHQVSSVEGSSAIIYIKRDDLLHPVYGGNKWRKLKYNLKYMRERGIEKMITFGGPFSNHIYAAAGIARDFEIHVTAYIRGSIDDMRNPVLTTARQCGVNLISMSRTEYAKRNEEDFLAELKEAHPGAHIVPEGGTNQWAVRGCKEIVDEVIEQIGYIPEYWIVPGGTGGTATGIAEGLAGRAKLHVMTALHKELFTKTFEPTLEWAVNADPSKIMIDDRFHFGGLAKWDENLLRLIQKVDRTHDFELDPLYTGKAWYGMEKLLESGEIPENSSVLFLHTGGQAGRACFKYRYGAII